MSACATQVFREKMARASRQGATPTALREIVREFATSKSAKMGNFGSKEPWKIRAFGKCRRKRLSCQCFQ
jgi:hypothetical protein